MCKLQTQVLAVVFLVLELLVIVQNFAAAADEKSVVQTCYGKIKGHTLFSRNNRTFHAFKGIPYAKPPVGQLRFKAPVPPDSWDNILEADKDGPMCIQVNYLFSDNPPVEGQEDCLYLNVYTPKLPTQTLAKEQTVLRRKPLLPVMVFIHYGGFFAGTGNSDYIGPEYFMDKNVVLVTFNYRLGVFGFLSTNDDAAPGNWALKDQVAVLKWVQDNIAAFGGNNKRVTIFGQSAGAGSVHYHLLSPMTRGLFQGAISQSGSTLSLWAKPKNEIQALVAKQQAIFVGCNPENDTTTMVECLRQVDAQELAQSANSFKYFSAEPFVVYCPVTEKVTPSNPRPYITDDPINLIKAGKFHRVPWIIGVVSDEGILRAAPLLRQSKNSNQLNAKFDEIGPQLVGIGLSVPPTEVSDIWKNITDFYLGGNSVTVEEPQSVQGFIDLYSDRAFTYGSYQSALLHSWKGHNPIWFYNFAYKGDYSYGKHFAGTDEKIKFKWGVSHCDDLLYLFPSKRLFEPLTSPSDILMSQIMIHMWTSFATFGNPTPVNEIVAPKWHSIANLEGRSSVKNSDLLYLNITGPYRAGGERPVKLELTNEFYPKRMMFWESLPLEENINGIK